MENTIFLVYNFVFALCIRSNKEWREKKALNEYRLVCICWCSSHFLCVLSFGCFSAFFASSSSGCYCLLISNSLVLLFKRHSYCMKMKVIKNIDNKCVSLFLLLLSFVTMRLLCLVYDYFGSLKNRSEILCNRNVVNFFCEFFHLSFIFWIEIRYKSKLKQILK